jgi:predicted TIM-barrel fold metal-dependent hydrolase
VGLDFDHAVGAGPPQQRLKEQDQDGIDAELLFASEARNPAIPDKAAFLAIVQGFNDYFIEEYCGVAPHRLVGVAVLPDIGVDEDIAEMRRCKEKGFKAVRLHTFPSGKSFPTSEDDKFWAAALDLDMPLTIHTSFPRQYRGRDHFLMKYPTEPEGQERPVDFLERIARHGIFHCGAIEAVQLILSGVFDRFPKLQIYWAENNIGWIPYFYQQMDQRIKSTVPGRRDYWGSNGFRACPASISKSMHTGDFGMTRLASTYAIALVLTESCGPRTFRTSSLVGPNQKTWCRSNLSGCLNMSSTRCWPATP